MRTLADSDVAGHQGNTPDMEVFGDPDAFLLLCKAKSKNEGWMKCAKAYPIGSLGCVVQTTTQQRNPDGSYAIAEALTFAPGAMIVEDVDDKRRVRSRSLVPWDGSLPSGRR